ncbi:ATP/GTP-binding protein [Planotetraspora sp. A-T 1434]|uniref:ATP/GTP-binding protein n=1 Tax=Planotetraspora sp. A-T 1434 TaxID=2979219 RepID=UPI0021BDF21D|nr:ATP/GTP-binding protein [Planotetraspora sp. A-T 1434]MCT9929093.1 ATP/GTP-binding protein [Planotetraspora sp. A-T 1434]
MSPRRARRLGPYDRTDGRGAVRPVVGSVAGVDRVESSADGDWVVRNVSGAALAKTYRCPGCDHEIRPGLPHIVSWPAWPGGEEERRHWHTACWRNRVNRGPGRSRY